MSEAPAPKTAVVTGAASGIGQRTVERLLDEGWTVWALDRAASALRAHAESLRAGERLRPLVCDVTRRESVRAASEAIAAASARVHALVCSAGVLRVGALAEQQAEDVDLLIDVNLKGPWLTVREMLPLLRAQASTGDPSRVVLVGSISGIRPKAGSGFYAATKAALHVLAGVFAVELAPSGVIVNAVAPGTVATPMVQDLAAAGSGFQPSGESPLGRIAQPDDVADVILFFLGDAARYVNGTVLPVDGGTRAAFVKR